MHIKIKCQKVHYGVPIKDTQTGLRGYPTDIIYKLIELFGERFEYETNILIECSNKSIPIYELHIKTKFAILIATVIARICSSLFNFTVNKNIVFNNDTKSNAVLIKYYILCICQMILPALLVSLLWVILQTEASFVKIIVDIILFVFSFKIQKNGYLNNCNLCYIAEVCF